METRRLITAMLVALAVYVIYIQLYYRFVAPPPATPPSAAPAQLEEPSGQAERAEAAPAAAVATVEPLRFSAGPETGDIVVGGELEDRLELTLTARGAAVRFIRLVERRKPVAGSRYVYRASPHGNTPAILINPVEDEQRVHCSFSTHGLWLIQADQPRKLPLEDLVWETEPPHSPRQVRFVTTLTGPGDRPLLRLTKTYDLPRGAPAFDLRLRVENLSDTPQQVQIEQDGPLGTPNEEVQRETRRVLAARRSGERVEIGYHYQRSQLRSGPHPLGSSLEPGRPFVWTALSNKYFTVVTRPVVDPQRPVRFESVEAMLAAPSLPRDPGDLLARMRTTRLDLPPGGAAEVPFEVYAGPKDPEVLETFNRAWVDRKQLGYVAVNDADLSCMCTFRPLPALMAWLLGAVHLVVRNYGLAIIGLVILVRLALHPLTVFQQKSMYRTQEAMARIQPRLNAIKERFANDRVRLQQEMMKVWAEEGVNPMAPLVSMVPLLIQMPILVALWVTLNSDIHLRHAPLDGWWIDDLASPDSAITFENGLTIPVLSWIPFIGAAFTGITSLNVLPILMGISMWLQQKYMPKPRPVQHSDAPRKGPGGLTPEEQLRQQQMIGYMMAALFPLMFYYMPAGLNLYWLSTNVFGICETLIIRRQLEREKQRRASQAAQPQRPRPAGLMARVMKRIAEQAEELQRKADEVSQRRR